jgi:DNA-binding GntR family transcriptional regulator
VVTTKVKSPIDRYTQTLREQVQELLQTRIISGVLPAGSRLNETELAQELDVSRGPIREAIQHLASDGLVVMEPHRGAYVRSLTHEDVAEIHEMRVALETHAARLAAHNRSPHFLRRLDKLLAETQSIIESSDDAHYPPHLDLHRAVISGCGVPRLERELGGIHKELALARARSGWHTPRAKAALSEHRDIVRAISKGDEQAAAAAMHHHLRAAWLSAESLGSP